MFATPVAKINCSLTLARDLDLMIPRPADVETTKMDDPDLDGITVCRDMCLVLVRCFHFSQYVIRNDSVRCFFAVASDSTAVHRCRLPKRYCT